MVPTGVSPRSRDGLGRPVPPDSPLAVEPVPNEHRSESATLALAWSLVRAERAFAAHELLEEVWKGPNTPAADRDLWRGLAQLCVAVTHRQRGNGTGAAALLRRGTETLRPYTGQVRHGSAVADLTAWLTGLAAEPRDAASQ